MSARRGVCTRRSRADERRSSQEAPIDGPRKESSSSSFHFRTFALAPPVSFPPVSFYDILASSTAMSAPTRALFLTSATLASRLAPSVSTRTLSSKTRHGPSPDPSALALVERSPDRRLHLRPLRLVLRGNGHRDQRALLEPERSPGADQARGGDGIVHPRARSLAAGPREKRREIVGAVRRHGNALRLQILQRLGCVEDALRARADDRDGGFPELDEVGGDVHGALGAAVDAADAAGDKDAGRRLWRRDTRWRRRSSRPSSRRRRSARGRGGRPSSRRGRASRAPRARASARPTVGTSAITAIAAGTAPRARTIASTSRAISRLRGYGMPCDTIVLSSATTARFDASAAATRGARRAREARGGGGARGTREREGGETPSRATPRGATRARGTRRPTTPRRPPDEASRERAATETRRATAPRSTPLGARDDVCVREPNDERRGGGRDVVESAARRTARHLFSSEE